MKTLSVVLVMISMCTAALFAQVTDEAIADTANAEETKAEKRGFFSSAADGTRTIIEINRENMTAVREEFKTNHASATATDPGIVKLNETKGFWNKIKVMFTNMGDTAAVQAENEKLRRAEAQSFNSYRELLEDQRARRQAVTNRAVTNRTVNQSTNQEETN